MSQPSHPIIVITGPTASGKTQRSVALAQAIGGVILSADSRLVYQHLNIGTAKPTVAEQAGIPHHLMDLVTPAEVFTVAHYQAQGLELLDRLTVRQPVILAGGTGLYLKAVLQQAFVPEVPPNPALREQLKLQAITAPDSLHQQLLAADPRRAAQLHPNDHTRLVRALEIIAATGKPVPDERQDRPYTNVHWFGLTWDDRDAHRQVIAERIQLMLKAGWLDEVEWLVQHYGADAHALQVTHGYPALMDYLSGNLSLPEALERIQLQVQQYARRQRTWFQRNPHICWWDVQTGDLEAWLAMVLNQLEKGRPSASREPG